MTDGPEPEPTATAPPKPRRKLWRWLLWGTAGLVALIIAIGIGAWFALPQINLASLVANRLQARLGRATTVATAHLIPGQPLRFEVTGVTIANAPWGKLPALYAVRRVTGALDPATLLHGPIQIATLQIDGLAVNLEHGPNHQPNWRDGPASPPSNAYRSSFPSIRDLNATDVKVTVRTGSGKDLVTALDHLTLNSADDTSPVQLTASGTQAGVPVTLDAPLHSFAEFHDPAKPFPAALHLTARDDSVAFDGTFTDPLGIDGAHGELTLDAPALGAILEAGGSSGAADVELHLVGTLDRNNDDWHLSDVTGALWSGGITHADLHLVEGIPGQQPDRIEVDAAFDELQLTPKPTPGKSTSSDTSLVGGEQSDTDVRAKVAADTVVFGGSTAQNVRVQAELAGGKLTVGELALNAYGTQVSGTGSLVMGPQGGTVAAQLTAVAPNVQTVRQAAGLRSLPIDGRMDGRVQLRSAGRTVNAAVAAARIGAVVWMNGGTVAREAIELLSTDIRTLFRTARGTTPITCLLAAVDLRGSTGTVSPLRIRAGEGTIAGNARFDLARKTFDLTVGSERNTTGALALDVPIRVSGSFANPTVRPALRGSLTITDSTDQLPPELRPLAAQHRCSR